MAKVRISRELAIRIVGTEEQLNRLTENGIRQGGEMAFLKTGAKLYVGHDGDGQYFGIYCGSEKWVAETLKLLDDGESWLIWGQKPGKSVV